MARLHTSFVLGYHGCDSDVGERILAGADDLSRSERDYDWLGPVSYTPHPDLIALYARRLTQALDDDADLWGQCPSVDLLQGLVDELNDTPAEAPLRDLIDATNRAQPEDGLA